MSLITLTTDFGRGQPLRGGDERPSSLSHIPEARIVDVTHSIPPQDIRSAAWVLEDVAPYWPAGNDSRRAWSTRASARNETWSVRRSPASACYSGAPTTDVLSRLARRSQPHYNRRVGKPAILAADRVEHLSRSRHFGPRGGPAEPRDSIRGNFGPPLQKLVDIPWSEVSVMPGKIQGHGSIDRFVRQPRHRHRGGQADRRPDRSRNKVRVRCDEHETQGFFRTYDDQPQMTLVAIIGSSGYLELAIVGDSAADDARRPHRQRRSRSIW
jgi:hypothetical protein